MRTLTRTLLSTCAVWTVAQGHHAARAQPDQSANQPPTPNPTTPTDPIPPDDPRVAPTTTAPASSYPVSGRDNTDTDNTRLGTHGHATWSDKRMQSGIGISTILGGGVTGFTDKTLRDTTSSVGGLWDLRVTIGSHIPLALDISYVGSATNINGLPLGQSGTLIGTTVEGALRFNVLPRHTWNPYIFVGAGWQRYDVAETNVMLLTSGLNDKDNLLEFPMGAGLSYRKNGLVADLRGTFRVAMDQNLVLTTPALSPTSSDFAPMHTWEASAAVGYEF